MTRPLALLVALAVSAPVAAAEAPDPQLQIAAAVAPAPPSQREGATVLGYRGGSELITLRAGEGDLVCLADAPGDERFHVACYHRALEPFMARGRRLRAEGRARDEILATREAEIRAGSLAMPAGPAALYSLTGPADSFDPATGEVRGANRVFVVYIPYATAESTGLATEPMTEGAPWIMSPGKPWAHIMVVQPAPATDEASAAPPGAM